MPILLWLLGMPIGLIIILAARRHRLRIAGLR